MQKNTKEKILIKIVKHLKNILIYIKKIMQITQKYAKNQGKSKTRYKHIECLNT